MTQISPKQVRNLEEALQKIDELEKRIIELEQNTLTRQEFSDLNTIKAKMVEDVFKQAHESYQDAKK